jgi:CRISPR-associated protein Csb3
MHCFVIEAGKPTGSLAMLLEEFAGAQCEQLHPQDKTASPLQIMEPFNLRLDWWWKPAKEKLDLGGANLKTWAGQQPGPLIFRLMKTASRRAASVESPLDYAEAIFDSKDGKRKEKTISPFYFDSRRQGTSLDFGFSPDEQNMSVVSYPAVESLALVGLQRFRPCTDERHRSRFYIYTAWAEPLPISVAAAAACGMVQVRSCGSYGFTKPSRGGEYVTMFSRATREGRKNV